MCKTFWKVVTCFKFWCKENSIKFERFERYPPPRFIAANPLGQGPVSALTLHVNCNVIHCCTHFDHSYKYSAGQCTLPSDGSHILPRCRHPLSWTVGLLLTSARYHDPTWNHQRQLVPAPTYSKLVLIKWSVCLTRDQEEWTLATLNWRFLQANEPTRVVLCNSCTV